MKTLLAIPLATLAIAATTDARAGQAPTGPVAATRVAQETQRPPTAAPAVERPSGGEAAPATPAATTAPASTVEEFKPVPLVEDPNTRVAAGQFVRSLRQYSGVTLTCDEIPGHRACAIGSASRSPEHAVVMWEFVATRRGPAMLVTLPSAIDQSAGLRVSYLAGSEDRKLEPVLRSGAPAKLAVPGIRIEQAQAIACGVNCVYGVRIPEDGPLHEALMTGTPVRFDYALSAAGQVQPQAVVSETRQFAAAYSDMLAMPDPATVPDTRYFLRKAGGK